MLKSSEGQRENAPNEDGDDEPLPIRRPIHASIMRQRVNCCKQAIALKTPRLGSVSVTEI